MDEQTPLGRLNRVGSKVLKAPPAEHRALLSELGFAVSERTWGGGVPRRGALSIS
jgi:hypothetical protein